MSLSIIQQPAEISVFITFKGNLGALGRYSSKFDKIGHSFLKLHLDSDFFIYLSQSFCILCFKTVLVMFKPQIKGFFLVSKIT